MEYSKDDLFKARIVALILNGRVDDALEELARYYHIDKPRLLIKRVKGHSKVPALYSFKDKTIYIQNGEYYTNPFVILHEFYHHLRNIGGRHRGTEYKANEFAREYINTFNKIIKLFKKADIESEVER